MELVTPLVERYNNLQPQFHDWPIVVSGAVDRITFNHRLVRILLPAVLLLGSCAAGRANDLELLQIRDALRLHSGMRVADIGAGDGEWSDLLARQVGQTGHVFSTEVDAEDVESIRRRVGAAGLDNVTVLTGDQRDTGVPDDCCDAILLRLVYHHFTDPERMREGLRRALRPAGLLAVVEITPQPGWKRLEGVPERDGHGIAPEDLVAEMESSGWVVVERHDDWGDEDDHYCIAFR